MVEWLENIEAACVVETYKLLMEHMCRRMSLDSTRGRILHGGTSGKFSAFMPPVLRSLGCLSSVLM